MTLELRGCPFQPLAAYLKALGVLRLVSEQADREARGYWGEACFVLDSALDRQGLIDFFLGRYEPTPAVAPWNGGSGFYAKDRKVGIEAIVESADARFAVYQAAIERCRKILARAGAEKAKLKADEDERRAEVLRLCRNELPDKCVDWLDAAIAISADGQRAFAPILGTGGNEGRLDYTNNFMENVSGLLLAPDRKTPVRELLENALFDTATNGLQEIAVGQYDPGRSGGFNQGQGISSGAAANPWNAVLTVEGAIAWAGGIYRKQGIAYRSFLCSPFTVRPSAVGYGSAADKDEVTARAEIWTPLWTNPARYGEIRALLREGRAAVDGRPAQTGLEFAQAAASLGVDRAISGFVRYSLMKRRGDSYIALPAGRFAVDYRSDSDLIRELGPLLDAAEWVAKGGQREAPNSWPPLRRAVEEGMFRVLTGSGAGLLRDTAAAVGALNRWLAQRGREIPSGGLSAMWVSRCADAEEAAAEVRIAAALASLRHPEAGPLARNLRQGDGEYSWSGRDLAERMLNTLRRRVLSGRESQQSPLRSGFACWPEDINRFLDGAVDDSLIEALVFAFVLVKKSWPIRGPKSAEYPQYPWPVYCLLKQMFLPAAIETAAGSAKIAADLTVLSLLSAGRVKEAAEIAERRLRIAGLDPVHADYGEVADARRLGASLLIPVCDWDRGGIDFGLRRLRESIQQTAAVEAITSR